MLAPNSRDLQSLPEKALDQIRKKTMTKADIENDQETNDSESDDDEIIWKHIIVQKYICNEMTWNRRKFDVRMYWLVASVDPLIVLYHDGYVRIGNSEYSEEDFHDTTAHLTTHTKMGAEGKATFDEFAELLSQYWDQEKTSTGSSFQPGFSPRYPWPAKSPVMHVRNQFKDALAEMIEVYGNEAFGPTDGERITSENTFSFYCADFILDNDLDVWFIEPQNGCGLDEDYYFRLEMHGSLFNGMTDIMEEIWHKQEQGVSIMPLENVGNWQVLYGDGLIYRYQGYQRSNNKASCTTEKKGKSSPQRL
jgi:hypothetical protein